MAALCLERFPSASPTTVSQTVLSQATLDTLGGVNGSPNRLLFSLIDSINNTIGDEQLLADPSFEYGTTFWTSDICTIVNPTGCPPDDIENMFSAPSHSGHTHATIGGKPTSFHLTSETVTVPSTVSRAELSFYLWIVTRGNKKTADDTLTIEIRDASGALLATLEASAIWMRMRPTRRERLMSAASAVRGSASPSPACRRMVLRHGSCWTMLL